MNIPSELRARAADDAAITDSVETLWYHRNFAELGVPRGAAQHGPWRRERADASVSFEPASEGDRVPGGPWLRRLLMHLCTEAVRSQQGQVALGPDGAALAAAIEPARAKSVRPALEAQVVSLLTCRLMVSTDGGPALSMLDARGRPRAVAAEWRTALRLNSRFLENLALQKVALDAEAIRLLTDDALAIDVYCWLAATLPGMTEVVLAESWPDLQARFGTTGETGEAFQAAFGAALTLLRAACPGLDCDDDAIGVGFSANAAPATATEASEPSAPIPMAAASPVAVTAPLPPTPAPAQGGPAPRRPERVAADPAVPKKPAHEWPTRQQPAPERFVAEPAVPERARSEADASEFEHAGSPSFEPALQEREPRGPLRQTISLRSHLTGLQQVIWLQRANGRDTIVIEVTPGTRYDPNQATVLALEPIVLQIAGGLHAREFERVAAWATANRDLIDDFWDGEIDAFDEIMGRVKKVPAPGWR